MSRIIKAFTLALFCTILSESAGICEAVRTIEVHVHRFAFTPAEITVKKGETVKLRLYSEDVPHSLLIKDFGVNLPVARGKPAEATFTPQKTGDFNGVCGRFCGSGHGRMKLTLHVTEN